MPADKGTIKTFLPAISIALVCAGLLFSRAMLSVGVVLLLLSVLFTGRNDLLPNLKSTKFLIPAAFLLLTILDYLRTQSVDLWQKDAEMMLMWSMLSLTFLILSKQTIIAQVRLLRLIFILLVVLVNLLSIANYLQNREAIDALLLQSKHIPIIGGMHHIYFGIVNAALLIILISEALLYDRKNEGIALTQKLEWTAGIIILISMHVLSSRTGLFSFYIVLFFVLIYTGISLPDKRKLVVRIIVPAILIPLISFSALSSFRNKIANTIEDFRATEKGGEDINFKSMGMRMEAWKVSLELIRKSPFIGVGAGNAEDALQKQYIEHKTLLIQENRIGPHNQFLEFGIKHGLIGILLLLFLFALLMIDAIQAKKLVIIGLTTLFFVSFLLESVLERQHGVIIFLMIYFFSRSEN